MNKAQQLITNELYGIYTEQELKSVSRLLLSHVTGLSFTGLILNKNTTFSDNQWYDLKKLLDLLKTGMPVQYVLGETEFCGLKFNVREGVLIPRPETEELVEWSLAELPPNANVLDIGTGSGCIAVALKYMRPDCSVWAFDLSPEALSMAIENARLNQTQVHFFQADVLKDTLPDQAWNLIISNPPYIPRSESSKMEVRVKEFEPELALFVPDGNPLLFYRVIAEKAYESLAQNGVLMFEIHRSFADKCVQLITATGFQDVQVKKDLAGNDRMILARKI